MNEDGVTFVLKAGGGALERVVTVPATRTSRIQEAHITIGHLWCELVDQIS